MAININNVPVDDSIMNIIANIAKEREISVPVMVADFFLQEARKKELREIMDRPNPRLEALIGIIKLSEEDMKKTNKEILDDLRWEYLSEKHLH